MRRALPLIPLILLAACAEVAGTGRKQLLLTSPQQEAQMGAEAYAQVKKQEKACTNPAIIAFVERVGRRVAAQAPDMGFTYEFTVLDSPTANAFCLPGGKVAVYTGILQHCVNEAGLATVLGHEIAHAIARHGGERMSQETARQAIGTGLAVALEAKGVQANTANLAIAAYGAGSQYLGILPYSRSHESEADHLGLMYMADAGYDPKEAVAFWERFGAAMGSSGPSFLSTHPASSDRAAQLAALMPEAERRYAAAKERHGSGSTVPR